MVLAVHGRIVHDQVVEQTVAFVELRIREKCIKSKVSVPSTRCLFFLSLCDRDVSNGEDAV